MRIDCGSCGQALNLPDSFKTNRFRCPKCKAVGNIPQTSSPSSVAQHSAGSPKPITRPAAPAVPVAKQSFATQTAAQHDAWYLQSEDGQQYGPISRSDLDAWVADQRVTAGCQVMREGDAQWQWADQVYPALQSGETTPSGSPDGEGVYLDTDRSSTNPYASPRLVDDSRTSLATSRTTPGQLQIATQGTRFANMILDNIFMQVLNFMVGICFGLVYVMANGRAPTKQDEATFNIISIFLSLLVVVVYFVIFEGLLQKSPAKFITGTKVVTKDGLRPSFGQIVGRTFARFIPFEAFSFLGGKNPVGWHDSLSNTRVVRSR